MPRTPAVLAALWISSVPAYALAAPERADDPTVPTAEASPGPMETPRPGLVKRKLDAFLSDDDGTGRGLHLGPFVPAIASVSAGAGLGPMLHFWTPDIGGSPIDVHASASYSIRGYQYYDFQVGLLPHQGKRLPNVERGTTALFPLSDLEKTSTAPTGFNIYASARYRDYPDEAFFGIGPDSVFLNRSDYRRRDGLYEGVVRLGVGRLSLMGRAGLLQTTILAGNDSGFTDTQLAYVDATAPGLFRTPDFVEMSGGAWLELRDQPGNAHRGVALGASFSRFDDRGGGAYQWSRVIVEAREYIPLGSHRHVVALRQATSLDEPDAGSRVPFYMQSGLGRSTFLGGFSSSRFRDDKLLAFQSEYRFEVVPKLELALLYDTGKVFPTMRDFDLRDMRRSWGIGIRLKSPQMVKLRLDVMHSVERTLFSLKVDPSF